MLIEKTTHKNHKNDTFCAMCGKRIAEQEWYYKIKSKYDDRVRVYKTHQLCYKFGIEYVSDHLAIRIHDFKGLSEKDKELICENVALRTIAYEARIIRNHRPSPRYHNAGI